MAVAVQYADACLPAPPEAREDNVRVIIRVISAAGRTQLFMCHLPGGDATRLATGASRREGLRAEVTRQAAQGLTALEAVLTGNFCCRCSQLGRLTPENYLDNCLTKTAMFVWCLFCFVDVVQHRKRPPWVTD